MKTTFSLLRRGSQIVILAASIATLSFSAYGGGYICAQAELVTESLGDDVEKSVTAIAQLRANGQAGLDALFEINKDQIETIRQQRSVLPDAKIARTKLEDVLDAVSQQRDSLYSRLFWYTDLEQAKTVAQATGRPILSLRLLGKLNEELSCANSRYFRTFLYADNDVSELLRTKFVLHWQTERPVPKITIDFGDGRTLEQTITGNSIHYVLDPNGTIIDGLPGLFAAKSFTKQLEAAAAMAMAKTSADPDLRGKALRDYHIRELGIALDRWQSELGTDDPASPSVQLPKVISSATIIELGQTRARLEKATSDADFAKIAAKHRAEFVISESAKQLVVAKFPTAEQAATVAVSKSRQEVPLVKALRSIQNSIALDTVRNDYLLHTRLHEWLATAEVSTDLEALNRRVYADLFLTPRNDPWLGLAAPDRFSGLDQDGRKFIAPTAARR